jgi:hypothetical protein
MEDLKHAEKRIALDAYYVELADIGAKALASGELHLALDALGAQIENLEVKALLLKGDALEIKSFIFGRESEAKDADFKRLLKSIGGYHVPDWEPGIDGFDPPHLERALSLVHGEAEPESEHEIRALERWQAKHGDA